MAIATQPKRTTHHKKRAGNHRPQNKSYLKTYWPYIPMLMIVATGFLINSLWSSGAVLGSTTNLTPSYLLEITIQYGSSVSKPALSLDSQLSAAAQSKADDMVNKDYWAHDSPEGKTPWTFISASGYPYKTAGENLAYGFKDASGVVSGWMNSPEHRENILNSDYQDVGFGIASSPNYQGKGPQTIVVAEYGTPVDSAANITFNVPATAQNTPIKEVKGDSTEISAQPVSRLALITGNDASMGALILSALAGAALTLFLVRHGKRFHKLIVKGEAFVVHHPLLDIAAVFVFTAGFVLTRTIGIIG